MSRTAVAKRIRAAQFLIKKKKEERRRRIWPFFFQCIRLQIVKKQSIIALLLFLFVSLSLFSDAPMIFVVYSFFFFPSVIVVVDSSSRVLLYSHLHVVAFLMMRNNVTAAKVFITFASAIRTISRLDDSNTSFILMYRISAFYLCNCCVG